MDGLTVGLHSLRIRRVPRQDTLGETTVLLQGVAALGGFSKETMESLVKVPRNVFQMAEEAAQ